MQFLSVIQNSQPEWLGAIEDHFEGRGIRFGYHRPFVSGGGLPDVATLGDGLVLVGGGGYGAATAGHRLPGLDQQVRLVRACLMLDKPILALGLGAQILSLAADGTAASAPLRLAVETITRVTPQALGGLLPERVPTVVYLRDRPVPPAYAVILAVDPHQQPAVFQVGARAFGFNAHIGTRRAMIEELVMAADDAPDSAAATLDAIADLGPGIEDALVPLMAGIIRACGWA